MTICMNLGHQFTPVPWMWGQNMTKGNILWTKGLCQQGVDQTGRMELWVSFLSRNLVCNTQFSSAREQMRQVCAKLANKPYEPKWKTLEVEDHYDWWGLAVVRGREY